MQQREPAQNDRVWIVVICGVALALIAAVLTPLAWFMLDVLWIKVGPGPGVNVITVDPGPEEEKQQEKNQW